ncbi:sterol desaturase family protein [Pontibacter silvestris]|uniref:Sterol desaturase family protein n=1 Tax=Pontibacter silvestris TaxID=2305183 RepID=A0ABW4WSC8_9BACT|nr:sterol desaturase family protein [Pontibacter silvestris]MCC9136297.1 sterol desaturase family protein [Pontibacter silvestris]
MLIGFGIMLATFVAMEGVAWGMHKYVLHGFMWFLHKSHHTRHNHAFELNDLFFAYYGTLAMLFFIFGSEPLDYRFWIGAGITLYGVAYFLIHDVFIHRRLKLFGKTSNVYLKALNMAHKVHHKTPGKYGSEAFGMLWVAPKYFKSAYDIVQKQQNEKGGTVHYKRT